MGDLLEMIVRVEEDIQVCRYGKESVRQPQYMRRFGEVNYI